MRFGFRRGAAARSVPRLERRSTERYEGFITRSSSGGWPLSYAERRWKEPREIGLLCFVPARAKKKTAPLPASSLAFNLS